MLLTDVVVVRIIYLKPRVSDFPQHLRGPISRTMQIGEDRLTLIRRDSRLDGLTEIIRTR